MFLALIYHSNMVLFAQFVKSPLAEALVLPALPLVQKEYASLCMLSMLLSATSLLIDPTKKKNTGRDNIGGAGGALHNWKFKQKTDIARTQTQNLNCKQKRLKKGNRSQYIPEGRSARHLRSEGIIHAIFGKKEINQSPHHLQRNFPIFTAPRIPSPDL
jgi:hypothetical protein